MQRLRGIRRAFGDREVLRGVDLDVAAHEVVALVGASGSGKSTLLRTINLTESIDDGMILLAGQDVSDPRIDADRVRARIGVVLATHEMAFARDVADRVVFLDAGRIIEDAPAAEFFSAPREERTREFLARFLPRR